MEAAKGRETGRTRVQTARLSIYYAEELGRKDENKEANEGPETPLPVRWFGPAKLYWTNCEPEGNMILVEFS